MVDSEIAGGTREHAKVLPPRLMGGLPVTILTRQGEVAGVSPTEGEERESRRCVSSPSDAFGATSPWRGRISGRQAASAIRSTPVSELGPAAASVTSTRSPIAWSPIR